MTAEGQSPEDESTAVDSHYKPRPCDFVDARGKLCGKVMKYNFDRHWMTQHALKELDLVDKKKLAMRDAKIVKSARARQLIGRHKITCPRGCVDKDADPLRFSRKEHLIRHLTRCCRESHTHEEAMQLTTSGVQLSGWQDTVQKLRREGYR
jgi:hypothetical protein